MKILVLGSKSFISKEIKSFFKEDFFYVDRSSLNLEDKKAVDLFFKNNYFDIVINTCTAGGQRGVVDGFDVLSSNLLMFDNLLRNSSKYGKLFSFCSGAAFDRRYEISNALEKDIFNKNPTDFYGLSKNLIARESLNHQNSYIFRIFGCFGQHELETRFLKNSVKRLESNLNISITKDKYMDYISAEDLCRVLELYIKNDISIRDINLVYKEKYKLSDIGEKIINFKKSTKSVMIEQVGIDRSYTGNSDNLDSLNIKLSGLEQSLRNLLCQN